MKNRLLKISRGYRLKLSTHKLIKNLQDITQDDIDTVLNRSCMMYYKTILEQNIEQNQNSTIPGVEHSEIPIFIGEKVVNNNK